MLAVTAVATGTAAAFGLAEITAIAGLGTMFGLMAGVGGSLRADLKLLSWCGPLLVLALAAGPAVDELPALAIAVPTVAVLGAAFAPLLGWRLELAVGAFLTATVLASATGIGTGLSILVRLAAAALGVAFAVVLRIVFGGRDPSANTRTAVSEALTSQDPHTLPQAIKVWRSAGGEPWLGEALAGVSAVRTARAELGARVLTAPPQVGERLRIALVEADRVISQLALAVRARSTRTLPMLDLLLQQLEWVRLASPPADVVRQLDSLTTGLRRVRNSLTTRVTGTTETAPRGARRRILGEELRALLVPQSALLRHALRSTVAVLVGASIAVWQHNPQASILVITIFAVLRPSRRDSVSVALQRAAWTFVAVGFAAAIGAVTPGPILVAAFVVLGVVGFPVLQRNHTALTALLTALVVVLRGVDHRSPLIDIVINFLTSAAIGATLALAVGYLTLPRPRAGLLERVHNAVESVRGLTWALLEPGGARQVKSLHAIAVRRVHDLLAFVDRAEEEPEEVREAAREAGHALDTLRAVLRELAELPEELRRPAVPAVRRVRAVLGPPSQAGPDELQVVPHNQPWQAALAAQMMVTEANAVQRAVARMAEE
ncbi:hypothetical protein GCM10012275_13590 [Longimycelium tulufanense]|uniref:Integral membrane bound transporter domain-containing protein n=1 Tax=Longimycelium tulufanense TaxID=907463 RepID=A0A8J3CDG2_9PSEU|nr:hypothetical protein GCM10012275_13590 [Longimycelium tulufanense]